MMRLGAPGAGGKKATVHFGIEGGRAEARFRAQQVAAWIVESVPNVAVEKRASSDVNDDCFAYVVAGWEMDRLVDLAELRPQIESLSCDEEAIELTGTRDREEPRQLRVFASEAGGLILQWWGEQTSRPMPAKQAVEAVRTFLRSGERDPRAGGRG
jgi:hypothetical protein